MADYSEAPFLRPRFVVHMGASETYRANYGAIFRKKPRPASASGNTRPSYGRDGGSIPPRGSSEKRR